MTQKADEQYVAIFLHEPYKSFWCPSVSSVAANFEGKAWSGFLSLKGLEL